MRQDSDIHLRLRDFPVFPVILILLLTVSCGNFNSKPGMSVLFLNQLLAETDSSSDCTSPQPEAILVTTSTSPDTISSTWSLPSGCTISNVVVVRNTSIPTSSTDGTQISGATTVGFTDTAVSAGTLYYYGIFLDNGPIRLVSAMVGTTSFQPGSVTAGSITVDGYDDESIWSSMPRITYSYSQSPDISNSQDLTVSGYMRLAYDSDNLYLFYKRDDKYVVVNSLSSSPWKDDSVEIFLDMNFDRASLPDTNDFQLIVSPVYSPTNHWFHGQGTGTDYSTVWNPSLLSPPMEEAVVVLGDGVGGAGSICSTTTTAGIPALLDCTENTDTDTAWQIEIKIPFTALGISASSITTGKVIGFTFRNNEDDQSDTTSQHSFDYTTGTIYNNPGTWGILQF